MQLRLRALPIGLALMVVALTASYSQAQDTESAATNPLHGVWLVTAFHPGDGSAAIDPSQPGLYIFAQGHYSAVFAPGREPRVAAATTFSPTPEEMVAQHESIIVNTGTYEISGSTVTFRPIIAKSPGFVGGYQTAEFQTSGDVLTLSPTSLVGADGTEVPLGGGSTTLRRLE